MLIPAFGVNTKADFTSTDFTYSFQVTLQLELVLHFQGSHLSLQEAFIISSSGHQTRTSQQRPVN